MKTKTFAARFFLLREIPGQIGPASVGYMIRAKSLAAAKRAAKAKAEFENLRVVEVFALASEEEIQRYRKGGFVRLIEAEA